MRYTRNFNYENQRNYAGDPEYDFGEAVEDLMDKKFTPKALRNDFDKFYKKVESIIKGVFSWDECHSLVIESDMSGNTFESAVYARLRDNGKAYKNNNRGWQTYVEDCLTWLEGDGLEDYDPYD